MSDAAEQKFIDNDLPLILAALHKARTLRMNAKVSIDFKYDGGCTEVTTVYTEKMK